MSVLFMLALKAHMHKDMKGMHCCDGQQPTQTWRPSSAPNSIMLIKVDQTGWICSACRGLPVPTLPPCLVDDIDLAVIGIALTLLTYMHPTGIGPEA
jgi:hypothetical protein